MKTDKEIEELAAITYDRWVGLLNDNVISSIKESFKAGYKLAQSELYSDEEVIKLLSKYNSTHDVIHDENYRLKVITEWFDKNIRNYLLKISSK